MVTNGNAARDGNLHHNIGLGASAPEEESGLMADCASERSFGSEHRFKKWSSNRGSFLNHSCFRSSNANTFLLKSIKTKIKTTRTVKMGPPIRSREYSTRAKPRRILGVENPEAVLLVKVPL